MLILRLLILGALIVWPSWAQAEEVRVRTGGHDEYSRLVFDWEKSVEYSLDRKDGQLVLSFNQNAQLITKAAQENPVPNIAGLEILSEEPLKVAISIPGDTRIRDLRAGSKVIVDVYNPKSGAQKYDDFFVKTATAQPEKPAADEPEDFLKEEEASQSSEETQEVATAEQETAAQEATQPEKPEETVKLQMRGEPTIMTISSTQNFGMAAFVLNGDLWMVNDKSDILIRPQPSGPRGEELKNITELEGREKQGKAYIVPTLKDEKITAMEGGILWRLFFSNDMTPNTEPVAPARADVNRQEARSGKLLFPLKGARSVLKFEDPKTGNEIIAVTVADAEQYTGPARGFVDFDVLPSSIGLAILPRVADLDVQATRNGVEISRPSGLTMVEDGLLAAMAASEAKTPEEGPAEFAPRIFDFKAWQLGGPEAAQENKRIILSGLKSLPETARAESLLTLGKMFIANGMGPEGLGILTFALDERPSLKDNAEFLALYGVASALSHHNADAFQALSHKNLQSFEEIRFWRAYVLADEADWQQAAETMPKDLSPVYDYTALVQNRLFPELAEISLRNGNLEQAEKLLKVVEDNKASLLDPQKAALEYLKGEAARQKKELKETEKFWEPLTKGSDDLYRAKAGLALTRLKVENKELTTKEAIDNLERLRYAWRGDQLEVQINYWLGRTYFDNGEYLKGLKIMRDAVSYDEGTVLGQRVAAEMADLYSELFLSDALDKVSALDALGLYDEFRELVPLDARGDKIIENMAEHLAEADLLTRAGDLLKYQLDHRLKGADIYRISMRLAALRLLDNEPAKALESLELAETKLKELPEELRTKARFNDIELLRARAISRKGRPDQALALLNQMEQTPGVNRLRADIAWTAGYWDDAAEALEDVVIDQNISLTRPLAPENTALLMQRAVSLNLAGDRIALANMREKYSDLMNQTDKAKVFEVITRPRQSGALADRETLLSVVSEVDLFKDFLDSYKASE